MYVSLNGYKDNDVMQCTKKNQQSIILMMPPATSLSTILIPKLKLQVVLARPFHLECHVIYCTNCNKKQKREISVDTLMTQIAKKHTEWYVNASEIGFISVRKILIMKLLDEIRDDQKIKEIAREVARGSSDSSL